MYKLSLCQVGHLASYKPGHEIERSMGDLFTHHNLDEGNATYHYYRVRSDTTTLQMYIQQNRLETTININCNYTAYKYQIRWKQLNLLKFQGSMNHPPRCKQGIWWMVITNSNEVHQMRIKRSISDQPGFSAQRDNIEGAVGGFPEASRTRGQFIGGK